MKNLMNRWMTTIWSRQTLLHKPLKSCKCSQSWHSSVTKATAYSGATRVQIPAEAGTFLYRTTSWLALRFICFLSNTISKLIRWEESDQYYDLLTVSRSRVCEVLHFHVHYMLSLTTFGKCDSSTFHQTVCVCVCVFFLHVYGCKCSYTCVCEYSLNAYIIVIYILLSFGPWICNLTYQETIITFHLLSSHLMIWVQKDHPCNVMWIQNVIRLPMKTSHRHLTLTGIESSLIITSWTIRSYSNFPLRMSCEVVR